jgi:hypothetical protein
LALVLSVPPVVITTSPLLVVVPGTSVYYAPDVSAKFFYKGRYYTVVNDVWSMAPAYNGPWAVIQIGHVSPPVLAVPMEVVASDESQDKGPENSRPIAADMQVTSKRELSALRYSGP